MDKILVVISAIWCPSCLILKKHIKTLKNNYPNINIEVLDYDFDGIGLFRTELIFMNSDRPLSFDEQFQIYSRVTHAMGERIVCFRTFDVGDDKKISYLNTNHKGFDNSIYIDDTMSTQGIGIL